MGLSQSHVERSAVAVKKSAYVLQVCSGFLFESVKMSLSRQKGLTEPREAAAPQRSKEEVHFVFQGGSISQPKCAMAAQTNCGSSSLFKKRGKKETQSSLISLSFALESLCALIQLCLLR